MLLELQIRFGKILQPGNDVLKKTHSIGTIEYTMIVGETERQNRPNANFAIDRYRFRLSLSDTENRHLRRIDDRRKMTAADASLVGNREGAALKLLDRDFPLAGSFRDRVQLLG